MEIKLNPIGIVRVKEFNENGVPGIIEIFEEYADGLKDIEGYSHIIIISYLDRVKEEERKTLLVKPRRFAKLGIPLEEIPTIGVFCTDSPHRPNPIGLTIVELIERKENKLYVNGLDLFDGTPVLDIKPYTQSRIILNARFPEWYLKLKSMISKKNIEEK